MPKVYKDLNKIQHTLENHYHNMLDIEFTIQDTKLYSSSAGLASGMDQLP